MSAQAVKITPIQAGKNIVPTHVGNVTLQAPKKPMTKDEIDALVAKWELEREIDKTDKRVALEVLDPENFDPGLDGGPDLRLLVDMLGYMRPGCTKWDEAFTNTFIGDRLETHVDGYGNHWFQVGQHPEIMWTSHTDTVHRGGLADAAEGRQGVALSNGKLVLADPYGKKSNCLGADDTGGIWLMLEMIRANVPGLYVFFRDEEIGGLGSDWAAKNVPSWFEGIKCAIALDRKGKDSVITHQGSRTASEAFGASLAACLGMGFVADPTGIFTDTANLTDVVGECSNLSIGYEGAHGPTESLDVQFIIDLRKALIEADFSALVFERKPGEVDAEDYFSRKYTDWKQDYRSAFGYDDAYINGRYEGHDHKGRSKDTGKRGGKGRQRGYDVLVDWEEPDVECGWDPGHKLEVEGYTPWGDVETRRFARDNYALVADFLEFQGFTIEDIVAFSEDVNLA